MLLAVLGVGGMSEQTSRGACTLNSGGACTRAPGSAALRRIFLFGVTFILPPARSAELRNQGFPPSFVNHTRQLSLEKREMKERQR